MDVSTYRKVIGHFATGVTVVTTAVDGWLHGMTANAVASVSLDPLLVLVCIDKAARANRQCAEAGRFGINILAWDQEQVARMFAVTARPERHRLRGLPFRIGPHGTPWIEGCLAYLECDVESRYDGGDHDIFVGRVLHGEVASTKPPLLFYRGVYGG
jgi:flavin reductase (DIM6/NTAB) family NADH-FMN oxidoreductase RutF